MPPTDMEDSDNGTKPKHSLASADKIEDMFRARCTNDTTAASSSSQPGSSPQQTTPSKSKTKGLRNFGREIRRLPRNIKQRLRSSSKANKNVVQEISIKPDRQQCWCDDDQACVNRPLGTISRASSSSTLNASRNGSAGSAHAYSNDLVYNIEDDGIPVVHDAEYNGGV